MLANIKSDFDKYCSDKTRLHSKMHMNCMMYNSLFEDTNYTPDKNGLLKLEGQLMFVDRLYNAGLGNFVSLSNIRSKRPTVYIDAAIAAKLNNYRLMPVGSCSLR
jgi:hypothetical protein